MSIYVLLFPGVLGGDAGGSIISVNTFFICQMVGVVKCVGGRRGCQGGGVRVRKEGEGGQETR